MFYIEHFPKNHLNFFIEKIWYCSADELTSANLTIPLPYHELVFNFSDSYKIQKTAGNNCGIENPVAWINGLQSKAYYSYCKGKHEMLGVLFKVNGLKAFTKYRAAEFTNKFIQAELVFGKGINNLSDQLQNSSVVKEKIALVEKFLLNCLLSGNSLSYLPHTLTKLSEKIGSKGSISAICNEASISNKSLIETYKKHIGINPVKYSHLQAINRAVYLLSQNPKQSFTKLAHSLNFYDQPHFNSLFKSVTSLTPSAYAKYVTDNKVDLSSANFITIDC